MFGLRIVFGASIVLNLILLFSLIWGRQGIVAYERLYEQSHTLQKQISSLDEKNITLSKEIRLLQSDADYMKKVIRNRLHFLQENEILYIFPEEIAKEPSGGSKE